MNSKLRILVLFLIAVFFSGCSEKDKPVPDPEEAVNIPSKEFVKVLIAAGVDTNKDKKISNGEAEAVTFLEIMGHEIADMTGIEMFINLDTLIAGSNPFLNLISQRIQN